MGGGGYGKHYNQRSISYIRDKHRLEICHKMYATQFSCERILPTKNAYIGTFFASNKRRECIIISSLALFWFRLNKLCKILCVKKVTKKVCKLAKYVMNCVAF